MGKKVIIEAAYGNHSNRLFQNLHFECFCKEHNIEYCNPTFRDMAYLYVNPCDCNDADSLKIIDKSNTVKKLYSLFGMIKRIRFNKKHIKEEINEKILLTALNKKTPVYVRNFHFRVPKLIGKYREEMALKYSLKREFYENSDFVKKIRELKSQGNILTGVHIRRGDYINWRGEGEKKGIYYYGDDIYEKFMESISRQLSIGGKQKHTFILFSNEETKFREKENLLISKEKWYIDQLIMSECDYLIGPPSTFSLWSCYIGKAKFYHIFDKNKDVKLQDFSDFKHWE
ncbi:MAG: alpha-1,2-fucosyltransferase [Chitinivibrionia bacterium]|nr:alpha-1,2-fucosyltransferase [Chitinivibrionia bacterium]